MSIFDFLDKKELRQTWKYDVQGVIWRLLPTGTGKLIGEERDIESKSVVFFCLNQFTGEVLWDRRSFGPQWWIGVEAIHREMLFLHGFATPDLPEHKMIIGVDVLSGERRWSNAELKFILAAGDLVYASKDVAEGNHLFELDYTSGAILRSLGNNLQAVMHTRVTEESIPAIEFPVPFGPAVAGTLTALLPADIIVGNSEGIEYGEYIILSYHERSKKSTHEESRFNTILIIVERSTSRVVFRDMPNTDIAAIVPESFFIQEGMLYYVKNRKTLYGLRLPAGRS